jgi:magnesium-transporting ATPase (P-type)
MLIILLLTRYSEHAEAHGMVNAKSLDTDSGSEIKMLSKEFVELQKKRIKRLLFNFDIAYFYTFIAGILVSLSVNIFTTALLTENLPISVYEIRWLALTFFVSAISAFGVSALLENARGEWESAGSPYDPEVIRGFIENEKRLRLMMFFFLIILISLAVSILMVFEYSFVTDINTIMANNTMATKNLSI